MAQIQTFYNGLGAINRSMVDVAAREALMNKTREAAYKLLQELASNTYQWPTKMLMPKEAASIVES